MFSFFRKKSSSDSEATESGKLILPAGMSEPVFRATCTLPGTMPGSRETFFRSGTGISRVSQQEAQHFAEQTARRHIENTTEGKGPEIASYAYQVQRAQEPLFETVGAGSSAAQVTVNSYGALVLNAPDLLFIDVDQPESDTEPARLLGDLVREQSHLGFRIYRTFAGWRFLCTTQTFDPATQETSALMEGLLSDPKYRVLCRIQKCFRARLTPKPWRAECMIPYVPRGIPHPRRQLEKYLKETNGYATCQFVAAVGADSMQPALQPLVEYHDRWTKCGEALPLA